MVEANELLAVRVWLGAIALFEVPEIFGFLVKNNPLNSFNSTLKNDKPEKRLWCFGLALLVLCRVQAVAYTTSPGVMQLCAAVHILEAVYFGNEYLIEKSKGQPVIFGIILANAAWFASVAARLS